jgi:hypothetical protein
MRSWVFRHRRRLEVLLGAAPEIPAAVLPAPGTLAASTAPEPDGAREGGERLRVLQVIPHPRRPAHRAG